MSRRPEWLIEGNRVYDVDQDREGVIQFVGEFEDPATRRFTPEAVFLRPEGGGVEWIVSDHHALRPADAR
ncbi:hypothetical protein GCM10010302_26590 [Streptomyces polychromogenes]|uniref:Uncharacterized protein n=1 Tax=Streptomyces polychromogenes TaxID=67342 RepID=A0ABP3F073_9ACTN